MHIVSFEVAKKLKEVGYSQTENIKEKWQYYNLETGERSYDAYVPKTSLWQDFYAYAPDLGKLIRELPKGVYLYHRPDLNQWYVKIKPLIESYADTPEDACALAWIELHKNLCKHGHKKGECPELCEHSSYHTKQE